MEKNWTEVIRSKKTGLNINFKELYEYRDLILLFVKRDFVSIYKQTLLGPLWYVIQPLLTTLTFTFVFGTIAKMGVGGDYPHMLFYMSGIVPWSYFSSSLNRTAQTFIENAGIFGKVYFPRLTVPLSVVISNLFAFGIQFSLLIGFIVFFHFSDNNYTFSFNFGLLLIPVLIFIMAILGLGLGIIISSLTTKYRDLTFLISFGLQLFMYATPIIYPLSNLNIAPPIVRSAIYYNPMTGIIEGFKSVLLNCEMPNLYLISYSLVFSVIVLFIGIIIFNKTERTFMDTI